MINQIKKIYNYLPPNKKDLTHPPAIDESFYGNLGDHIVVGLDPNNEPTVRVVIDADDDPQKIAAFAEALDNLVSGQYIGSILATLKDIGVTNPEVKDKVRDIAMSWEFFYASRKNTKNTQKNQPLVCPTSFSKNQVGAQ